MIKEENLKTLEVIQGDTLTAYFKLPELVDTAVDKVMFTCKQLNLNLELERVEEDSDSSEDSGEPILSDTWLLWYQDSSPFRIGQFTYDLTVVFPAEEEKVNTYIYNGNLIILPRQKSRRSYNPYWEYPHNTEKEH